VVAVLDYRVVIADSVEHLTPRMSFVLHRKREAWQLVHLHASVPWSQQEKGESYPLRAIEERNRKLELIVAERTRELQQAMEQLQKLATTDKLTGISNRAKLDELIADEHRYLQRHLRPSSIAICDIDHFKAINDAHGHLTGDRVLVEFAGLLGDNLRAIDRLGRWGGEEFLVLLPEASGHGAQIVAERVQARLAEHDFGLGRAITMSVGIAEHRGGETVDTWISRADEMLYRAKNLGRNRILVDGV
jgi:diguanylate cyclase (GGDEF)-like protein